ncbi:hypothetical protein ACI3L1_12865 [Deinococcus sp. SM5_A1]|uniref:hypothetical protein n=1 Tax=Deinococcus sp. SM5_A1 TaxID=3379094 RepID=UPI00385C9641
MATSGLEMSQNAQRLNWTRDEEDARLHEIMRGFHRAALINGRRPDGSLSYLQGANVTGFVKVAQAMLEQGVV